VTLGPAVSAGGLFQPVLGVIADRYGPQDAFAVLAVIPLVAIALAVNLKEPADHRRAADGIPAVATLEETA
jgi:FSR family fosmidomycin resistance protein-like MFS transporter